MSNEIGDLESDSNLQKKKYSYVWSFQPKGNKFSMKDVTFGATEVEKRVEVLGAELKILSKTEVNLYNPTVLLPISWIVLVDS